MHYLGMAALRLHGDVTYDPVLVGLSVVIAVVAATAALWAALNIKSPLAVAVASLVMGGGGEQHALHRNDGGERAGHPSGAALPGATAMQFIFPLAVGLGSYLFLTSAFVALSPTAGEREASASAQRPVESAARLARRDLDRSPARAGTRPEPLPSEEAMRTPRRTPDNRRRHRCRRPVTPARGRRAHAGPPADERPDADPRSRGPATTPARGGRWLAAPPHRTRQDRLPADGAGRLPARPVGVRDGHHGPGRGAAAAVAARRRRGARPGRRSRRRTAGRAGGRRALRDRTGAPTAPAT